MYVIKLNTKYELTYVDTLNTNMCERYQTQTVAKTQCSNN